MDKKQPLVSVLIANFNNGKYLQTAVNSVLKQTYSNWEIIIIDDASTDNSWDIILKCARTYPNIRCYQNPKNLKVAATKAKATQLAKGDICAILDPDDALVTEAIEKHVAVYLNHSDCSMVGSNYYDCDASLQIKQIHEKVYDPTLHKSYLSSNGGIHHLWSFSKSKYQLTGGFDARFILAEDQDLFYKLEEVGDIYIIDQPLYCYRSHQDAISQGDKIALAYAYHILAMLAAKKRRPFNGDEAAVIKNNISHFMSWGFAKIDKPMQLKLLKKGIINDPVLLLNKYVIKSLLS